MREFRERHIFIIGSKGIPANYGGFETFVDKLTEYKKDEEIIYHVACMSDNNNRFIYNDAWCFNVKSPDIGPARAIYYDIMALRRCIKEAKRLGVAPIIYVLACRIGPFIGYYKNIIHKMGGQLFVNPDGHEWKRSKWSKPVREYWKLSERLMVKHADLLICDSKGIEEYIQEDYKQYNPNTTFISYGAEFSKTDYSDEVCGYVDWCNKHQVQENNYYLIVGRFVPENNYETMIREFLKSNSNKDLVIITTENESFQNQLEEKLHYKQNPHVKFVGTVYDQKLLKRIREKAFAYIHGHEVGGTNPSLLEALGMTNLNLLLGVNFNKEVGENTALYWNKEDGNLAKLMNEVEKLPQEEIVELGIRAHNCIETAYSWDFIVNEYENLFLQVKEKQKVELCATQA
ncbi:MAG: DUF1972 domain-containing protein [Bacillota bacterium]|nr:DUF1972 domain-containing protein [Bacillota bacterium]